MLIRIGAKDFQAMWQDSRWYNYWPIPESLGARGSACHVQIYTTGNQYFVMYKFLILNHLNFRKGQ